MEKSPNRPKEKNTGKDMSTLQNCPHCHYKSVMQTEMKRHIYKQHNKDSLKMLGNSKLISKADTVQPSLVANPVKAVKPVEAVEKAEQVECLICMFDCDTEQELDSHKKDKHKEVYPTCENCALKDNALLEHVKKIERLELNITDVQTDLEAAKLLSKKRGEEKDKITSDHQESMIVIAEQQRKITISDEKIKVLESLQTVGGDVVITNEAAGEWEEVWEDKDDNSGNLVRQRAT